MNRYLRPVVLITGIILAAGCATSQDEKSTAPSSRTDQAMEETTTVGSRIRRKRPNITNATRIGGESASQQLKGDPIHATGEQIIQSRTEYNEYR